jgi:hypothetical protein
VNRLLLAVVYLNQLTAQRSAGSRGKTRHFFFLLGLKLVLVRTTGQRTATHCKLIRSFHLTVKGLCFQHLDSARRLNSRKKARTPIRRVSASRGTTRADISVLESYLSFLQFHLPAVPYRHPELSNLRN